MNTIGVNHDGMNQRRMFGSMIFQLLVSAAAVLLVAGSTGAWGAAATQVSARTGVLSGRVVDAKGNPVANATVSISGGNYYTTKTDADGRYSFATVARTSQYRVGVQADGFVSIEPFVDNGAGLLLSPQSQAQRDFVLQRGVVIHVTVTDLLGAPVRGADVDVNANSREDRGRSQQRKQTSAGGVAIFSIAASKAAYCVMASMNECEPVHEIVTPDSVDAPVNVELQILPGTPIKGVAICTDGKPGTGWTVSAYPEWWVANYMPRGAAIDKNGSFTLTDVGPGTYRLMVLRKHTGSDVATLKLPPTSQPFRLDLPFVSPASMVALTGTVRVTGGRPDYVMVQANGTDGGYHSEQVQFGVNRTRPSTQPAKSATTRPAIEGTFTFDDLSPGVYRITFESQQLETKVLENVKVPGDSPVVELNMVGKPVLRGTVTDGATGKPLTQFSVRAKKLETIGNGPGYMQEDRWIQASDPGGNFAIELVGPGIYKAQVAADGYAWALSDDIRVEGSKPAPVQVKMTPGGSVSGQVVDPSGAAVSGAKVIPLSMNRTDGPGEEPGFGGDAGAAMTDAQGHFKLSHLPAGEESIKIVSDQFAPQVMKGLHVSESAAADAGTVKMLVGGTVEGVVYDPQGKPAAGVPLQLYDNFAYYDPWQKNGKSLGVFTTDAKGHYRAEHLPADLIYVNVQDAWTRQGVTRRIVRPVDGKTTQLDLGGTTPVKGRLLISGKPANATRVELAVHSEHFGPVMAHTTTDSDGRFTFFGPPAGPYTLFYMLPGDRSQFGRIKDVTITDSPGDLGDVAVDVGPVNVTVQADDPADLAKLTYGSVRVDSTDTIYLNNSVALQRAGADGTHWTATGVPAGKMRAALQAGSLSYSTPFERAVGAAETNVIVHVPRASARLTLNFPPAPAESGRRNMRSFQLRNADSTVLAYMGPSKEARKFTMLPPGTYSPTSEFNLMPTPVLPPIELKAGDEKTVDVPPLTASQQAMRPLEIEPWTGDGLPLMGAKMQLADAQGKTIESARTGELGLIYLVPPGHYRASIERPGAAAFVSEIDVPAASDPKLVQVLTIHLTVP